MNLTQTVILTSDADISQYIDTSPVIIKNTDVVGGKYYIREQNLHRLHINDVEIDNIEFVLPDMNTVNGGGENSAMFPFNWGKILIFNNRQQRPIVISTDGGSIRWSRK